MPAEKGLSIETLPNQTAAHHQVKFWRSLLACLGSFESPDVFQQIEYRRSGVFSLFVWMESPALCIGGMMFFGFHIVSICDYKYTQRETIFSPAAFAKKK